MRLLFIGDIFGRPGRRAVREQAKRLRAELRADYVIANAENTTHGKSVSPEHLLELSESGVDFFTMGNHTWGRKDIAATLDANRNIIRPYNAPSGLDGWGRGTAVVNVGGLRLRITNLIGRSCHRFENAPNPFQALDEIVAMGECDLHIVDFHAESTGEKNALALDFDGKVSAVLGTHTHVQTNDPRVLARGTGFITDVGMTGAYNGVIGAKPDVIIAKQRRDGPFVLEVATGPYQLNAVVIEFNKEGKVASIQTVRVVEGQDPKVV